MELQTLLRRLQVAVELERVLSLRAQLDAGAPLDWRDLAAVLALSKPARVIGISGGQGAGKTTLARELVAALRLLGSRAVGFSLDDFYLPRAQRLQLADAVHPLLATRGVPGTHDMELLSSVLQALLRSGTVRIPVFDKGRDDRLPASAWRTVQGPVAHVVVEGWCLGARAQPPERLVAPVNSLEEQDDPTGTWRHYVNDALGARYESVWSALDWWLYLKVPDFAAVARWRAEQERGLPADRRMTRAALDRFLAHYRRITLWMLETAPHDADMVVHLDADHRVRDLHCNRTPGTSRD